MKLFLNMFKGRDKIRGGGGGAKVPLQAMANFFETSKLPILAFELMKMFLLIEKENVRSI